MKLKPSAVLYAALLALALGIYGCGASPAPSQDEPPTEAAEGAEAEEAPAEPGEAEDAEVAEEPEAETQELEHHQLGETVSTDIVEFTLDDMSFAIALENGVPFGNDVTQADNHYLTPKEYDAEEDTKNPFVASKGHVLVYLQFTGTNLDRTDLELDEYPSNPNYDFVNVAYDGQTYTYSDFTEKEWYRVPEDYASVNGITIANVYLSSGSTVVHRGYIDIPMEPESLDDSFEIIVTLPNSDGTTTSFSYVK